MNNVSDRHFVGWLAVLLLIAMPMLATADDYRSPAEPALIVFGDSLSDGGNFFVATGTYSVRPFDFIPSAPYLRSGFHFTNGRTWIEQIAARARDRRSGRPSLRRPGRFTNYAYGSARSRSGMSGFDLGDQVGMFLTDFGGRAPDESVYVMWTGANDVRDALDALQIDPTGATSGAILQSAVQSTVDNVFALYGSGAQSFMIVNSPNIGLTPAVRAFGPQAEVAALQLSFLYNQGLAQALDGLSALPGIDIQRVDAFAILNDVVADPEAAGFTNVTESCITPDVIVGAICDRPGDYLFWDGIHPTRAGHRHLAWTVLGSDPNN